jgi:hypothetical protein
VGHDGSVVDQDVDTSESLMGLLHDNLNVAGAADIAFEGEVSCAKFCQFFYDVVEGRYVNYDDRSIIVGKGFRYVSPYTLCCPGNHRDSLVCHISPLLSEKIVFERWFRNGGLYSP